jgi:uncharacterized protein YqeY
MALIDDINAAITESMKSREQERLSTLRMLKTALVNKSIERGRALDEAESLQVVTTLIKQRRDSIDQFRNAGRHELADKEAGEIGILEKYLPPPVDQAELDRVVAEAIVESGATSARDMGKVMKAAMAKLAGRGVDGKTVNELVRRKLSG